MALVDLWKSDRDQISGKRIDQLIAFAGEGRLRDKNGTSRELRELLAAVPSDLLGVWIEECLQNRFNEFGFVLQDIVNEIGRRLNFRVTHGVYRGNSSEGFDGFWLTLAGRGILVESKSTTAYSINLTHIAEYRSQLAPTVGLPADRISILIVVGTEDTLELEAQVRGSRFAWDVRLLGMRSLFRLLKLREALDDPEVERQIQDILVPQEFTRLDRIVDLVFATAEDAQSEESEDVDEVEDVQSDDNQTPSEGRLSPASFHSQILPQLESHFGSPLVKRSRIQWGSPDDRVLVSCQVSKYFVRGAAKYWFGLKRSTKEALEAHSNAYCAFGLGSPDKVVVIPFTLVQKYLPTMFTSPDEEGGIRHWHVRFSERESRVSLLSNRDREPVDVTEWLLRK